MYLLFYKTTWILIILATGIFLIEYKNVGIIFSTIGVFSICFYLYQVNYFEKRFGKENVKICGQKTMTFSECELFLKDKKVMISKDFPKRDE